MWPSSRTHVALILALSWVVASTEPAETEEKPNLCAMTEILVAMKDLVIMLSTEIRDLRQQVRDSCQASPANATTTTTAAPPTPDIDEKFDVILEGTTPTRTEAVTTPIPTTTTTEAPDKGFIDVVEYDEDYEYTEPEESPINNMVEGLANWWNKFSLFAPKPSTTTPATSTEQPDDALDDYDTDGEEEEEKDVVDGDEEKDVVDEDDEDDVTTRAPKRITTTTTTTSTTTPVPFTLPPAPTSCPSPFQLLAEGCYLLLFDPRDWKSWGEAYAFCQRYGGELAAPWRLSQLQKYLSRHYSDAFWVGARYVLTKQSWEWLSGRKVQQGEWAQGQPHRNPSRKCVFLEKWSGYHAKNFFCGEKYPFVCEIRGV